MTLDSQRVVLARRPKPGLVSADDFKLEAVTLAPPARGEVSVRVTHISLDPAMRGWLAEGRSYVPPVAVGAVMRALAAGVVEVSADASFKPGDAVTGMLGVCNRLVAPASSLTKVDTRQFPPERWLAGLGMPGMTAYFGLLEVGVPKPGETVVVSAASGAVGSIVGQIAKLKGCRAIGIAGGPDKCRYVVDDLGFDACLDYKAPGLAGALKAAAPQGVDVYFENVGGDILDTVLAHMNLRGRVALCGLISSYNATEPPAGLKNLRAVLTQRLKIQGLIVFDWVDRYPEAVQALSQWAGEGKLKLREDVRDGGLAAFVPTLNLLFSGGNFGKLVLKV